MPKLPEGVAPRAPLNCLIAASTKTMLYALVGELELSQGEVVDRAIEVLTASIAFGPASLNTKKLSKKAAHVAALKASDPLSAERDDIEHGNMELPSGGSIAARIHEDAEIARRDFNRPESTAVADWRSKRKPLLKPSERKK